jgi:hypothetical protein
MSKGKKPDFPKPKKSQRHGKGGGGAGDAGAQPKKKGAFGGAKPHRKPKIKGKVCRACGGAVVTGRESLHEARDLATGVNVHPCRPCPHCRVEIKVARLLEDHGSCGLLSKREAVASTPSAPVVASSVPVAKMHVSADGNCIRCKKPVADGEESHHFTRRSRANTTDKQDTKWHCQPSAPSLASMTDQIVKSERAVQEQKVVPAKPSFWSRYDLWNCGCDIWDISSGEKNCPNKNCGGKRPSQESRPRDHTRLWF